MRVKHIYFDVDDKPTISVGFVGELIYKCNNCGDTFSLDKQDEWSAYCFHCGKGLLQLIEIK